MRPVPVTVHTRSPSLAVAERGSGRRGSIAASRTGVPRLLVADVSCPANSTMPPAIAYLARCGCVHS